MSNHFNAVHRVCSLSFLSSLPPKGRFCLFSARSKPNIIAMSPPMLSIYKKDSHFRTTSYLCWAEWWSYLSSDSKFIKCSDIWNKNSSKQSLVYNNLLTSSLSYFFLYYVYRHICLLLSGHLFSILLVIFFFFLILSAQIIIMPYSPMKNSH